MQPDAVIVGAGVIGASVAYHLAAQGLTNLLVLERDAAVQEGSSASCTRATGGFRAQYGTDINVRLSLLARRELLEFEALTGVNPGYDPRGYLFLASSPDEFETLQAAIAVQRTAGMLETRALNPEAIHHLNPALNLDGITGGTYCPWDGFIRPLELRRGYQRAAETLGAQFRFGTPARLERHGAGVRVVTADASFAPPVVVNAAGAWAAALLLDLDLPVTPLKRQIAATEPSDALPSEMPMSIYAANGFHLRVRDGRVLLLMPWEFRTQDLEFEADWLEPLRQEAHRRVPALRGLSIERGWAGLYEMSPDHHALLGRHWNAHNLYLVNGSSGHGVMHSPALGKLLAEIVTQGRASSLDAHALRPERFLEGDPIAGNSLL